MAEPTATREPEIIEAMKRARAEWPELEVADATLRAWLAARADDSTPLSRLHLGDLMLACACASGDAAALAAFHAAFDSSIRATLSRAHVQGTDPDEMRQQLDVHLFVAEGTDLPRIAEYRGVGSLRTWVRVVASRLLLNAGRRKSARHDTLTSQVERDLGDVEDPELDWLKERYRGAFRQALTTALAELPAADRTLLRLCVVNGLSATGVASIYGVHRATAKRWIARIRRDVLVSTRSHLRAHLRVEPDELDSIMGMIGSRLEASVRRCLATNGASDVR